MKRASVERPAVAILFALSLGLPAAADDATLRLEASAFAGLQGLAIPMSAIGLPTSGAVVQTAVSVAANDPGNVNGAFCKVTGLVRPVHAGSPDLEFEVNLPLAWNQHVY